MPVCEVPLPVLSVRSDNKAPVFNDSASSSYGTTIGQNNLFSLSQAMSARMERVSNMVMTATKYLGEQVLVILH